jgi:transposase
MDIDLAALPDDVETLRRMVRSLAVERTALSEAQAEIERLRLIVQKLQRSQFGRRAERLDEGQLQFGFEDLEADLARAEARSPSSAQTASSSKPPRGDRPSLPSHLPREDRRFDIEIQACPCCGTKLHLIGETVSEMLDQAEGRRYRHTVRPFPLSPCSSGNVRPGWRDSAWNSTIESNAGSDLRREQWSRRC